MIIIHKMKKYRNCLVSVQDDSVRSVPGTASRQSASVSGERFQSGLKHGLLHSHTVAYMFSQKNQNKSVGHFL